ncbi:hypothetical protein ACPTI2_14250, partial [Enterococcus faecalis]|uniref:hypothetical protein n=1 Tax=Enterococcus faecalis TaxID=1351 RepID=UPI003CC52DFB
FQNQQKTTLLDNLPEKSLLFVDDNSRMLETEREIAREEAEWQTLKIEEMRELSEQTFGVDFHDQLRKTPRNTTYFS